MLDGIVDWELFVCDEWGGSIHLGQLDEVDPIGEDAIPELLWPFEVAGHCRQILTQYLTTRTHLKTKKS